MVFQFEFYFRDYRIFVSLFKIDFITVARRNCTLMSSLTLLKLEAVEGFIGNLIIFPMSRSPFEETVSKNSISHWIAELLSFKQKLATI